MLNRIWTFFFIGGFAAAIVRAFMGHTEVWRDIVGSTLDMAETLRVCRFLLAKGKNVVYFPEGQRSGDGRLKEFRKGVGILIKESGSRALPVYLEGAFKVWPRSRPFPLPGRVTVHVGSVAEAQALGLGISGDPYAAIAKGLQRRVSELVPR